MSEYSAPRVMYRPYNELTHCLKQAVDCSSLFQVMYRPYNELTVQHKAVRSYYNPGDVPSI